MFLSCPIRADYVNWSSEKLTNDSGGFIKIVGDVLVPSIIKESTSEENYLFFKIYKTKDLIMDQPHENGDGLCFYSEDGMAKLTIAGSNNVLGETVDQAFNEELQNVSNPSY